MNQRAVVSVPGKLILMGEHAAVYGRPALVAAADPRARAEVVAAETGVSIELPDFNQNLETSWAEIESHAAGLRDAWQRYAEDPTPERFRAVRSGDAASLVMVALGEIAAELPATERPPIRVRVESSLPVGSGFGSSAATAVAVIVGPCSFSMDRRHSIGSTAWPSKSSGASMGCHRAPITAPSCTAALSGPSGVGIEAWRSHLCSLPLPSQVVCRCSRQDNPGRRPARSWRQ